MLIFYTISWPNGIKNDLIKSNTCEGVNWKIIVKVIEKAISY